MIVIVCTAILVFQVYLILKTNKILKVMSDAADQIKAALNAAKATLGKVATDVQNLHTKITELSTNPSAAEVEEIKALAADLNTTLQNVDAQTEDESTGGGEGGQPNA